MTPQRHTDELLTHFSRTCGTQLSLENGVCALFGGDQKEAATLELPAGSTQLFIHCAVGDQGAASRAPLELLMRMNFEANAMRGCWLAVDAYNTLRLCTQQDPLALNSQQFTSLLNGFIALSSDLRKVLA